MIRLAPIEVLETYKKDLTELLVPLQRKYLAAAFASAHLINRVSDLDIEIIKKFPIPGNPVVCIHLLQLISSSKSQIPLYFLLKFLDYPNSKIQTVAAAAIKRNAQDRQIILEQTFNTLLNKKKSHQLVFQSPPKDENIRNRGLIILCETLCDSVASSDLYYKALKPILMYCIEKDVSVAAQKLLTKLIYEFPEAFHSQDLFILIESCFNNDLLIPEFLDAFVTSFGLFAAKKCTKSLLPKILSDLSTFHNIQLLHALIPYLRYLESAVQFNIHKLLIEQCDNQRFNAKLFNITFEAIIASSPIVSPYVSTFLNIASGQSSATEQILKLKPLLEPNGPPPPHQINTIVKVDKEDMCDTYAQTCPDVQSQSVQCTLMDQ